MMKFGIIGNDQMLLSCLRILMEQKDAVISFVLFDTRRLNVMNPADVFCREHGLEYKGINRLNDPEIHSYIQQHNPDYILSINNFFVIRPDVLAIPQKGTINFHNSVPSCYHGLNIPSWVIMNGETSHGAMWHFVEPAIDTGDVICWKEFQLTAHETAASLMVKCIRAGIEMFPELLNQLFSGNIQRFPQTPGASYYSRKQPPENNGVLNFTNSIEVIGRMVRGLNYMPYPNPFVNATIRFNGKAVIVNDVEESAIEATGAEPGTVVGLEEEVIYFRCADGVIAITDAMDEEGNECNGELLAERLGLKQGDIVV